MEERKLLSKCEEQVMVIIWDSLPKKLSLMEITDKANKRYKREWNPKTISTFLARLVSKKYVSSYRQGRVFYYEVLVSKKEYAMAVQSDFCKLFSIPEEPVLKLLEESIEN